MESQLEKCIIEGRSSEGDDKLAQLFRAIESNPVIIVICDINGKIHKVNSKFSEVTGFTAAEVVGVSLYNLSGDDPQGLIEIIHVVSAGKEWAGSLRGKKKDGGGYLEEASFFPIQNSLEEVTHFVKVAEDVTVRRMTEESVRFLAFYDDLTALPNRRLFHDRLLQALVRNERSNEILAVISLDIDHFKKINNSYGHVIGDQVIKILSDRATRRLRAGDTLAHFSGDNFKVLLPSINRNENVAKVAENLLSSFSEPICLQGETIHVTASVGISLYPHDGNDAATLLKNAELAMIRAQDQGGDNYQIFTPALNELAVKRMALEKDLRRAIELGSFILHYQPQYSSRSHSLVCVEALVRMLGTGGRVISPEEFIPVAEETGMILRLSNWVLHTACQQAAAFHRAGLTELRMAVNLSPRDFLQQDLPGFIRDALSSSGLSPRFLELEITEGTIMADFERTLGILQEIKATGVSITIDDFGTGYSSLLTLKTLPADVLKIDRSFVEELSTPGEGGAIARAIILLAHDLGMRVVAEGVETEGQAAILAGLGCDLLQGFHFGRPMTAEEFLVYNGRAPQRLHLVGKG